VPASEPTNLVVEPLTAWLLPAFEELMDQGGPAGRCWCMYWRIGATYRRRPAQDNRDDFRKVVSAGPPPGLLAMHDGVALGWCQVTPREAVPGLERAWRLRRVDEVPVWAITCFYVRKGHRRQGVMSALIDSVVDHARTAGAPAVEAYPLDAAVSPSSTGTGYAAAFAEAGFFEVARRTPERPIMRFLIESQAAHRLGNRRL
jgi:GNAT superfamily N-acetyltransferase